MSKKFQNYCCLAVLFALMIISMLGVLSVPADDSATWFIELLISKAVGFIAGATCYLLFKKWRNSNLINDIDE